MNDNMIDIDMPEKIEAGSTINVDWEKGTAKVTRTLEKILPPELLPHQKAFAEHVLRGGKIELK